MSDSHSKKLPALSKSQDKKIGYAATVLLKVCLLLIVTAQPTLAFDIAAPFVDPLRTLPKLFESGVTLPGDSNPVPCPVSKDFSTPLALAEAVDLALCNNPQIKATWASIKVQAGALGEARAAYLPTLSATTNNMKSHTTYPGSSFPGTATTGQAIAATLSWHLFDFGGRGANLESANQLLLAAIDHHDTMLQNTLASVVQAYFDAHTAQATLQAKEQDEANARSTLETAQRRQAHGMDSRGDTLQAMTAMAKASLDKNRAIGDYQKALSVLVYSIGVPPQTHLVLADDLKDQDKLDSKSLEDWMGIAEKSYPEILSARAKWESDKQKIISTRSGGLPSMDFSATSYQNGYPGQGLSPTQSRVSSIGVSLTFPLFDGFSTTYKIRSAEAQAEEDEATLHDTEHNTLMAVVKAYADAISSLQNLQASENLLNVAQESMESSKRKYERGAADILEMLNTQSALADAQQERILCLDEWRGARLKLLASVGLLGRSVVTP